MVVGPFSPRLQGRKFKMMLNGVSMAPASVVTITLTVGGVSVQGAIQTPHAPGDPPRWCTPEMFCQLHGNLGMDHGMGVFRADHLYFNLCRMGRLDGLLADEAARLRPDPRDSPREARVPVSQAPSVLREASSDEGGEQPADVLADMIHTTTQFLERLKAMQALHPPVQ